MKYRALLFGNSVFNDDSGLPRLEGPPTDLSLMLGALTHAERGIHDRVDVESYLDRSKNEMLDLMEAFFARAESEDQLLLYYSGHGFRDADDLYLCARDTDKRRRRTAVSDGEINGFILDKGVKRMVIILDCCYSGSFKGGDDVVPERLGAGRFVLSSCRSSQLSADATKPGEGSVFTRFLVEALLATDVDADGDGFVTLSEVYGHLLPRLRAVSKQIPQRSYENAVGDPRIGRSGAGSLAATMRKSAPRAVVPEPELEVGETEVSLKGVQLGEELPAELIDVFDKHGGKIYWNAETSEPWIALTKRGDGVEMKLRPPKVGINRGIVNVRAVGRPGSRKIRVTVAVDAPVRRSIGVEPTTLDLGEITVGKSKRSSIRVHHAAGAVSAVCDDDRVKVVVKADLIDVRVTAGEAGEIETEIQIEARNGRVSIPVRARVETGPILTLDPTGGIDFGRVERGDIRRSRVVVENGGSGNLEWTCTKGRGDFFEFVTSEGKFIDVVLRAMPAGIYHGALSIRSNGGAGTIEVRAEIVNPTAVAPTPPPQPPRPGQPAQPQLVFGPGRWQIDAAMFGTPTSRLVIDFAPNGALAGTLQAFGMPMAVPIQGQWAYDMMNHQLGMNIFGPGLQDTLGIQMIGAQGASIHGTNGSGFNYQLTRIG